MANQILYTLAFVIADGVLLTEESSVSLHRRTNSQAVMTTAKGYSGESPGATMCEIQVKNAMPATGLERDFGSAMNSLSQVELGIICAGKTARIKGTIIEDSIQHSVDAVGTYDFTFRGPMPLFV